MLNLESKTSYYQFDSAGMLVVPGDERSWRDSIGRNTFAYIAYNKPEELRLAVRECWTLPGKKWRLLRHPHHNDEASRDHYSYALIIDIFYCGKAMTGNLPRMRGMNLWMKSLTGNKRAEWWYYTLAIPGAYIGNAWLRFCRWAGRIGPERRNEFWIHILPNLINRTYGWHLQNDMRTKWQKFWGWIILNTIPAFALHIKAWQLYVMPENPRKEKLKKILLKRVGKSNILVRLLLGDEVTMYEVKDYPNMTGYRPGVYLDESCRRDIREMTAEEAEFNNYEKSLIEYLWNAEERF